MEKENVELIQYNQITLQDRFKKFMNRKKKLMKNQSVISKKTPINRQTPEFQNQLRKKFIQRAKAYIGVPYAKKYQQIGSQGYNSPIFLDCCGLVRQVVFDLKQNFGFQLCRWNQAYQYDVLQQDIPFQQLVPGDLIFYQATYYSKRRKRQLHNMVHVQIFLGGQTGESTIASRLSRGRIQIFDTYKFVSKNYYNIVHHFKSLRPWIRGVCKSNCLAHPWRNDRKQQWVSDKFSIFAQESQDQQEFDVEIQEQTCFVGSGNNLEIVKENFMKRGWRILDKNQKFCNFFHLKWVKNISQIDFSQHIPQKQFINFLPNISKVVFSRKALAQSAFSANLPIPQTFDLTDKPQLRKFMQQTYQGVWIQKSLNPNLGKSVQIIKDLKQYKKTIKNQVIVQKYIQNPLLFDGKKFVIKFFGLVAFCQPFLVLGYPNFYGKKALEEFQLDSDDPWVHSTTYQLQKKHFNYQQKKQDLAISQEQLVERFGELVFDSRKKVFQALERLIQERRSKVVLRKGCFQLFEVEVGLDCEGIAYMIGINSNPGMWGDTEVERDFYQKMINQNISVVLNSKSEFWRKTEFFKILEEY